MPDYTCPYCRHKFPAAMLEGTEAKLHEAYSSIPVDITEYIQLFQPREKLMQPKRELKLVVDVNNMVRIGHVQWKDGVPRNADPSVWAEAIAVMLKRKLKLPMTNHNYIRAIAWEIADERYRKAYAIRVKAENAGTRMANLPPKAREVDDRPSIEEMKAIRNANMRGKRYDK